MKRHRKQKVKIPASISRRPLITSNLRTRGENCTRPIFPLNTSQSSVTADTHHFHLAVAAFVFRDPSWKTSPTAAFCMLPEILNSSMATSSLLLHCKHSGSRCVVTGRASDLIYYLFSFSKRERRCFCSSHSSTATLGCIWIWFG